MKKKHVLISAWENIKAHSALTLIAAFFILNTLCAILDSFWLHRSDETLGALVFEIIIFLVPLLIYISLKHKSDSTRGLAKELNVTKLSHRLIFLPITAVLVMIFGTILLNMLFFGMYDMTNGFTLYGFIRANGDDSTASVIYMLLTFVLLPSVMEEIVFRQLLTRTYAAQGLAPTLLISGFFYSLSAFSVRLIPAYFFAGIIYSLLFILTGTLTSSIIAHVLFNLYGLFLQTNIANYFVSSSDVYVLVVSCIILFVISLIIFLKIVSNLLVALARANKAPPELPRGSKGIKTAFGIFCRSITRPMVLVCMIAYAVFVVVFAFFS